MNVRTTRGLLCTFVAVALFVAGCDEKPTHESVTTERVAKMRQFVDVMKTIKDEPSAKAAKPKLDEIRKNLDELQKKGKELGTPPEDVKKKLQEKHAKDVQTMTGELFAEINRLRADPTIAPHLPSSFPRL